MEQHKNKDLHEKNEGISFEENPVEYIKSIYKEAKDRNDQLRAINLENQEFYEGKDKVLEDRLNDTTVKRSALFIHELTPAVDARIGDLVSRLEEREYPVTQKCTEEEATKEVINQVTKNTVKLNEQLRACGYLTDIFEEHCLSAEINRTPSVAKVFWKSETKTVPVATNTSPVDQAKSFFMFRDPSPKVRYEMKEVGMPCAEWIPPDQFLYEPNVSRFEDSNYCIHEMWVDYNDLISRAEQFDYDKEQIQKFKEELGDESETGSDNKTISDEIQADEGTPFDKGYKDGKYLLTECYVAGYNDLNQDVVTQAIVLGNKYLLKKIVSTEEDYPYKGIKFPFVPIVITRKPGTIENYSSIDKGKYMQRLYNEGVNSYLDGLSYRIFPPFKIDRNNTNFAELPVYAPGALWKMNNLDGLKPVIENIGQLPDLMPVMEGIGGKIRNVTNSPDVNQGFNAQQYEKATATKARAVGSNRRAVPTNKKFGMALVRIAEMFIALNAQHAEDGYKWVYPVKVDVPSLTNVSDPEQEKQDTLLMISTARQDPLFQSPLGQKKVRNMWEDFCRMVFKKDVFKYIPTEDELLQELDIQSKMQNAMIDKESTKEQMAVAGSIAPQNGGQ